MKRIVLTLICLVAFGGYLYACTSSHQKAKVAILLESSTLPAETKADLARMLAKAEKLHDQSDFANASKGNRDAIAIIQQVKKQLN